MLRISYLVLASVVVAALLLWPQSLGGETAFVTYNQGDIGSGLQLGDVAVVRRARDYAVGDLVAVRTSGGPPIFGWVASHEQQAYRISFRLKREPAQVMPQYIVGRLWFNLGDLSRGATGSVLNFVGIQTATDR